MKPAFIANILALALCASCTTTSQPGAAPPALRATGPARVKQLGVQAYEALDRNDFAGALEAAGVALNLDPKFEEAWIAYGMASLQLKQPDRARQSYERALAVHQAHEGGKPRNGEEAFEEIYLLSLLGRDAEAVALLKSARQEFPNDLQLSNLAILYTDMQKSGKDGK